jgi:hypothetical protein
MRPCVSLPPKRRSGSACRRCTGESIALIRGEEEERAGVDRSLRKVLAAWREIAKQNMKTTVVSQTSSYIDGSHWGTTDYDRTLLTFRV